MEKGTLYIAYGNNLNITQMSYKCPGSRIFGVGKIENYRLIFKAAGVCAYATIEPCEGNFVPAVIWEIGQGEEERLDGYEGFPTHYFKQNIDVTLADRKVEGMTYIMNEKAHYARPGWQYFNSVLEGYRRFGLEEYKLYEALYRTGNKDSCKRNSLQYYRQMRMLTQKQLAGMCGLKEGLVQKYESGERDIARGRADNVLKLAEILEIPVRELIK